LLKMTSPQAGLAGPGASPPAARSGPRTLPASLACYGVQKKTGCAAVRQPRPSQPGCRAVSFSRSACRASAARAQRGAPARSRSAARWACAQTCRTRCRTTRRSARAPRGTCRTPPGTSAPPPAPAHPALSRQLWPPAGRGQACSGATAVGVTGNAPTGALHARRAHTPCATRAGLGEVSRESCAGAGDRLRCSEPSMCCAAAVYVQRAGMPSALPPLRRGLGPQRGGDRRAPSSRWLCRTRRCRR